MKAARTFVSATVTALVAATHLACSSDGSGKPVPASRQPGVIAIRNTSGRQLRSMTIQDYRDDAGAPSRMGSVSPVVPNFTYTFVRPTNAPPLPGSLLVIVRDADGADWQSVVDTRTVLRSANGAANEAIVFEFKADHSIVATVENVQPQ